MKVKQNADYDVLLNPNDMSTLVSGNGISFWVILEDREITFRIKREK